VINQKTVSETDLLNILDRGVTVITGNNRLAAHTRQCYEKSAMVKGREVWPTPQILPWTIWLQNIWEDAVVSGVLPVPHLLLTAQQEQYVWKDIIATSMSEHPLQQEAGTARQAQQAWELMQAWQLQPDAATFNYNSDSATFLQWTMAFESRCRANDWLSASRHSDEILRSIKEGKLADPGELALLGFDELSPQQQSLLNAFATSGCEVNWLQLAGKKNKAVRIGCTNGREEALTIARWVRQRLEKNPQMNIGVIVPELSLQRKIIVQAFDDVLVPHALYPGNQSVARPYNLSLGLPLSSYPIINTALRALSLLERTFSLEDAGKILRTPFIAGWEQEASARALLEGHLREASELQLSLKTLRYHASQTGKAYACPLLVSKLDAWQELSQKQPRSNTPGQWAENFANLLNVLGWAAGRSLSSEEYQATEAWRDLLLSFAALEPVTGAMTTFTAIAQLRHLAGERTFQPQTGVLPVQVLGLLEASGLQFDALWIMGLHDGIWPPSPRANPFIPLLLQRKLALPHSSEERELEVSQRITRRMLASANEIIVSYPQRNGDEMLRTSPLIADLPPIDIEALQLHPSPTWCERVHDSADLVTLDTDVAPPLAGEETRGGSSVFKYQAACPFRAFAELRLGARPLAQAEIGLDAMARGSLIHSVLEKVWTVLGTQQKFLEMDNTQLKKLIATSVEEAIAAIAYRYPQTLTGRFREIEHERICRQLSEWLELEKQRPPFHVVEKEMKHEVVAGGVRVNLKVDRIDKLEDDHLLVIDYKTGEVNAAQWFGERPDEPQLPLYSMAVKGDIAGVLFAQVRAGSMAFKGVTQSESLIAGVKSFEKLQQTKELGSWIKVLDQWRDTMENLGKAYRNGDAWVDPKKYPHTCDTTYCELKPLCRINEMTILDGDDSGEDDPL
jgi:ATP-dependent helicase/nuclease subunit B